MKTRKGVADAAGLRVSHIDAARKILETGCEKLIEEVTAEKLSLSAGKIIADDEKLLAKVKAFDVAPSHVYKLRRAASKPTSERTLPAKAEPAPEVKSEPVEETRFERQVNNLRRLLQKSPETQDHILASLDALVDELSGAKE